MNRTREARLRGSFLWSLTLVAARRHFGFLTALCLSAGMPCANASAEIVIGIAGPMSGQYESFGSELKTGAEAAVAAINAMGGINGELLTLATADDGCDTKRAVEAAKELIAKDARAVVGHFCSGASLAASQVYGQAGILMLSPASSNPALTENNLWNVFRLTGRDDAAADLAANAVKNISDSLAVVISDGNPASATLASRFVAVLNQSPIITIKPGQADLASEAAEVVDKRYSHIFIATAATDALRLVSAFRGAGFTGQFLASEAIVGEAFASKAGAEADGLRATFPADPSQNGAAAAVVSALNAGGKTADGAVLPSYAAVQAITAAAKGTTINDGRAMARWLHANRVPTVIGEVSFDAKGDLTTQPFAWYQFNAGRFRLEQY